MPTAIKSIIGLDVGGKRIGVAIASLEARLPRPLTTVIVDENVFDNLNRIISQEGVNQIVVGLPRGLDGQSTEQTAAIQQFGARLEAASGFPVFYQDEAVTSKKAEAELQARGRDYRREDVDSLAAVYILEDWLAQQKEVNET